MKTILFFMLCTITVQSLIAQDTVTLKNGKIVSGKIMSLSYGITLLTAKDTMKYTADEVASIMFCSTNKNCPDGNTNSNGGSSDITSRNTKNNPCNCIYKQNESSGNTKLKADKRRNSKY
ncbi:MAG: hypothetical protein WKG06_14535 [Segetibacter sp.]